jgi:hypothetical protein
MALETAAQKSRRALLAAGAGALAASLANALGRPMAARGANGDPVTVGGSFTATSNTMITNSYGPGTAIHGHHSYTGSDPASGLAGTANGTNARGVSGYADATSGNPLGVLGYTSGPTGIGVGGLSGYGGNATGVMGISGGSLPLPAAIQKCGVFGQATQDSDAMGVFGKSTTGRGVVGQASSGIGVRAVATSGTGIYASASTGTALRALGRVYFDNCAGVATFTAGMSAVTVNPGRDLTGSTAVTLTPYGDPGTRRMWATVDTAANSVTIHLSSAVTGSLKVAWLALN